MCHQKSRAVLRKREVLDLMPRRRTKRQIVIIRNVPKNIAEDEKNPAHGGMHQAMEKILEQWPLKERPERVTHDAPGQAAQERQLRSAEEEQRRNNHGQQQMLHHVSGQKE